MYNPGDMAKVPEPLRNIPNAVVGAAKGAIDTARDVITYGPSAKEVGAEEAIASREQLFVDTVYEVTRKGTPLTNAIFSFSRELFAPEAEYQKLNPFDRTRELHQIANDLSYYIHDEQSKPTDILRIAGWYLACCVRTSEPHGLSDTQTREIQNALDAASFRFKKYANLPFRNAKLKAGEQKSAEQLRLLAQHVDDLVAVRNAFDEKIRPASLGERFGRRCRGEVLEEAA